jgi:hypothetical protein
VNDKNKFEIGIDSKNKLNQLPTNKNTRKEYFSNGPLVVILIAAATAAASPAALSAFWARLSPATRLV